MTLGEIIKNKRHKAGLSQSKLGDLIGSMSETIMNIETSRTMPRNETIWRIGAVLCLSYPEITNCLQIAKYHRNNRKELEMYYALGAGDRFLKKYAKY